MALFGKADSADLAFGSAALGGRADLVFAPPALGAKQTRAEKPLREKLAADPQRPRYHFLPAANWMNDPNGPLQWKGEYHLFYQYNPNGAFWGTMHWGHARSPDLVHWEHLPIALAPSPGGPDKDGVFSGSAFVNRGMPTLVYTGVNPEVQCLATSEDMIHWKKFSGNPVIAGPPPGLQVTGFRDPSVWKDGDTWLMTVGAGFRGKGGAILLYASKDAIHWEYRGTLCEGPTFVAQSSKDWPADDPVARGEMWECPDFFPLGDKYVLLVSTQGLVFYLVGNYRNRRFQAEGQGRLDLGGHLYAAKSMADNSGRRLLWGWIREARSEAAYRAAGWAGAMALPRVLSLRGDGLLGIEPVEELQALRQKHRQRASVSATASTSTLLEHVWGDAMEILAELDPGDAEEVGLRVRSAPDGSEQTAVICSRKEKRLYLDGERSSLSPDVQREIQGGPFELSPGERLRLRIFLDGSVAEVFANGRAALTERIYPTRADSLGVGLLARRGNAKLVSLDVWEMRAISPDRLTT
jgi:beta-fructofuranosidase